MNRNLLLAFLLVFGLIGVGWASMDDVLKDHDPSDDTAATVTEAAKEVTSIVSTIASGTTQPPKDVVDMVDKITKLIEDITKALEEVEKTEGKDGKEEKSGNYTVVSGDCLWNIAQKFYGDGSAYTRIVEANKDKYPSLANNPDLIYPGWNLTIPGADNTETSNNNTNSDSGTTPDTGSAPSGTAEKVAAVAKTFPSRYNGYQKFPYAAGTEGGNLGCANVVSAALKEAGVNVWSLNVTGVKNALLGKGWKLVSAPPWKEGDVVCWSAPSGSIHGHIGIAVKNGNSMSAMNNSSSQRKPIFSTPVNYRAVSCTVRKI